MGREVSRSQVLVYLEGTGHRICWKMHREGWEEKALGDTRTCYLRNWKVGAAISWDGGRGRLAGEGDQAGAF